MNIVERVVSPTPSFFARLRNIGLILAAVSTTIAAAPLPLPAVVLKVAGYIAIAAGVAGAVSQTAVVGEAGDEKPIP